MIQHGGFLSSSGEKSWYLTTEEDEVITFEYPINALLIETLDEPLTIQINGTKETKREENLWNISSDDKEGIEGFKITSIMIHGQAGQMIRWQGLIA